MISRSGRGRAIWRSPQHWAGDGTLLHRRRGCNGRRRRGRFHLPAMLISIADLALLRWLAAAGPSPLLGNRFHCHCSIV